MRASGVVNACNGESRLFSRSHSAGAGLDAATVDGEGVCGVLGVVVRDLLAFSLARGVFDLETVGVVSVEPGIVESRLDLGVMYEFMADGGGRVADDRVVGTGIKLLRCG